MFPGSPILYSVFYATAGPWNSILLFTGRYFFRGEARFRTPHGYECELLLVLGLDSLVRHSAYRRSTFGGISALALGYSHGVASFQNLDGLQDSFTFFVSQN